MFLGEGLFFSILTFLGLGDLLSTLIFLGLGVFCATGEGALGLGVFPRLGLGVFRFLGEGVFLLPREDSDSSSIVSVIGAAATERRFFPLLGRQDLAPADSRRGVAPRFIGVSGGSSLSNCSGLNTGPNDTRFFLLAAETSCSVDFLFLPLEGEARDLGDIGVLEAVGDDELSSTS